MTQVPQSIPELYNEEIDNSTQQQNADVAIASSSHSSSGEETETKQQRHNQRKRKKQQDRLQQKRELNAKRRNKSIETSPANILMTFQIDTVQPNEMDSTYESTKKPPMTSAERSRAYRERKKYAVKDNVVIGDQPTASRAAIRQSNQDIYGEDAVQSITTFKTTKEPPMTSAERSRAYRERKKYAVKDNTVKGNQPSISRAVTRRTNHDIYGEDAVQSIVTFKTTKRPPMTSAERSRAYRDRKKYSVNVNTVTTKNPPMTSTERSRAYREKKKVANCVIYTAVDMNPGTFESIVVKEEPLDHDHHLDKSSRALNSWGTIEFEDTNVEPNSSKPIFPLLQPVIKKEVDMTSGSSESSVVKDEPLDHDYHPGKPRVQESWEINEFKDVKVEPNSSEPISPPLQSIIEKEAEVPKEINQPTPLPFASGEQSKPVELEIKDECEDCGIWKDEPIDPDSEKIDYTETEKTVDLKQTLNTLRNVLPVIEKPLDVSQKISESVTDLSDNSSFRVKEQSCECDVCKKAFTHKSTLRKHLWFHFRERPHKCIVCKKTFISESALKQHMFIHSRDKPHVCDICDKAFSCKRYLKTHALIHNVTKPHECGICGKGFSREGRLKSHIFIHGGKKPYECNVCGKSYTLESRLKEHSLIHSGEKPYECGVCKKTFLRERHWKAHMRIHAEEKLYECSVCKKAFIQNSHLKRHMLIHTAEKPHVCDVCNRAFTIKGHLKVHMLFHSVAKPYECEICSKGFSCNSSLKLHRLIHSSEKPYECGVCGKAYVLERRLKEHMRIHSGEKPHECGVCRKAFLRKSHCKTHMLTHTDKEPYKCDVCRRAFSRKDHLKDHMSIHSGKKTS